MEELLGELKQRYVYFTEESKHLTSAVDVRQQAETLLTDIIEAGSQIKPTDQRLELSKLARILGEIIYKASDFAQLPSMQLKPFDEKHQVQPVSIEFTNRLNELYFITNIYCPRYLLLSAPMGYGKSRLLEAISIELQRQNWFCANISLSPEQPHTLDDITVMISQYIIGRPPQSTTIEKIVHETVRSLLQQAQMNIALLIDAAETLHKNEISELINRYILIIREILARAGKNLRVIFSGRYISDWVQIGDVKIPLTAMALTPFDFSAVQQIVDRFDSNQNLHTLEAYRREFASYLMHFTGGHPLCIAEILSSDFGYTIDANEEKYYDTLVKPVIEEIMANIHDDLQKIFAVLSVVRRFNARLLRKFIDHGLIAWTVSDEYQLENRLLKTHLVSRKNGFLSDDITRRILAIYLRRNDVTRYCQACTQAIAFYESELNDPTTPNPAMLAVELLFQKLQMALCQLEAKKEQLFDDLAVILNMMASGRTSHKTEILNTFTEQLNNDWEFRFLFNYLLREGIYNNEYPFQELMEKIANFTVSL